MDDAAQTARDSTDDFSWDNENNRLAGAR